LACDPSDVAQWDPQEVSNVIVHGFEMQDPTPDVSLVEAPLDVSQAKAISDRADGVFSDSEVRLKLATREPSRFCLLNWGVDQLHGIHLRAGDGSKSRSLKTRASGHSPR
jgi:hypothetical protein